MGRLLDLMRKEHSKPNGFRVYKEFHKYISDNYIDILEVRNKGYSYKQINQTICNMLNIKVHHKALITAMGRFKDLSNGYFIKYKLDNTEYTDWKEFENQADIEKYIASKAEVKSKKSGFKVASKIISVESISRADYEKHRSLDREKKS